MVLLWIFFLINKRGLDSRITEMKTENMQGTKTLLCAVEEDIIRGPLCRERLMRKNSRFQSFKTLKVSIDIQVLLILPKLSTLSKASKTRWLRLTPFKFINMHLVFSCWSFLTVAANMVSVGESRTLWMDPYPPSPQSALNTSTISCSPACRDWLICTWNYMKCRFWNSLIYFTTSQCRSVDFFAIFKVYMMLPLKLDKTLKDWWLLFLVIIVYYTYVESILVAYLWIFWHICKFPVNWTQSSFKMLLLGSEFLQLSFRELCGFLNKWVKLR